ncbi:hypothetical protein DFH09DRAFT_1448754 [Mycena vulgaris]|nr:hypothetical protein DFH09DRAFT_1448754 [Mycena vulgaris]
MYALSWALRSTPEWQFTTSDAQFLFNWRRETLEQQNALDPECRLTERMVGLGFLAGYVKMADNARGIERGCFDAIWYSDRLISDEIAQRLKNLACALENVPETEKDRHLRSNGQVLNLVDPSLYCVVYGRTHAYLRDEHHLSENLLPIPVPAVDDDQWPSALAMSLSRGFCWLPSDVAISPDGSVRLVSPYINNIHPVKHQSLYRTLENVVAGFVPMFERVLGEIDRKTHTLKGGAHLHSSCIWPGGRPPDREAYYMRDYDFREVLPEASPYSGGLETTSPISLRRRTVQCIIKLANIRLTPEQPYYARGSWHVDGMANEHIIATGIYYYDDHNITESQLSFRVPTEHPAYHERHDGRCMHTLYGIDAQDDCVQKIGSMPIVAGRALSYPNLFEHCVSSFRLTDASKPGHRKILALFLVDPSIIEPIASATDVPPQQAVWAADELQCSLRDPASLLSRLPQELADLVKAQLSPGFMTPEEVEIYRLELMKERRGYTQRLSCRVGVPD